MKKSAIVYLLIAIFLLGGCTSKVKDKKNIGGIEMSLNQIKKPETGEEIAVIKTNHGDIKVRLFPEASAKAVENFKTHAKNGYYDGVTFHRVMKDFMIQGGDPDGSGRGGKSIWGSSFEDEFHPEYHNLRGSLSMANAGPNTNGSQFFIVQNDKVDSGLIKQMRKAGKDSGFSEDVVKAYEELGGTPHLDFKHAVFGQVFEGMDVVDEIANVKTGPNDKPKEDVVMEKIEIVEYK